MKGCRDLIPIKLQKISGCLLPKYETLIIIAVRVKNARKGLVVLDATRYFNYSIQTSSIHVYCTLFGTHKCPRTQEVFSENGGLSLPNEPGDFKFE